MKSYIIVGLLVSLMGSAHAEPKYHSKNTTPLSEKERADFVKAYQSALEPITAPGVLFFSATLDKKALNVISQTSTGLPQKQFTAQFGVLQNKSNGFHNEAQVWYLESGESKTISEYESINVSAIGPKKLVSAAALDQSYCFEILYQNRYVLSYTTLANGDRKPVLTQDVWSDTACVKPGESKTLTNIFRDNPVHWTFTLDSVSWIPLLSSSSTSTKRVP